MSARRVLAIGLDGYEVSLEDRFIAAGELPAMAALRARSACFRLDHGAATEKPATIGQQRQRGEHRHARQLLQLSARVNRLVKVFPQKPEAGTHAEAGDQRHGE